MHWPKAPTPPTSASWPAASNIGWQGSVKLTTLHASEGVEFRTAAAKVAVQALPDRHHT